MLDRIIEFALAQRLPILVAAAALALAGALAWRALPVDAFPDIAPTQVKIVLKAPGMTPEEVETRVVAPLELELLGLPHAAVLRSTTKYAIADLTLDFAEGTDIYWARQQVNERLAGVELPPGVTGGLAPIATPLSDVFMFTIEGGDLDLAAKRTLLDWTIRPALRTLPGVAEVNTLGGEVRAFTIVPDRSALAAAGLHFRDLAQTIDANNRNDGSGRLGDGEESLIVRAEGAVRNLEDLRRIVLATRDGVPVRVGDVAELRMESLTRYGAVTRDGEGEAVQGIVVALRGADAGIVVRAVRERLAELAPNLPPGVSVETFHDRSALIDRAVGTVTRALVEATIFVVLLLLVFLGEFRAALVVALTLPFAALGTFLLMRLTGMSANLMSLGGLAVAIGMLVDAAVVVVENTVRRLDPAAAGARLPRLHRVYRAASEVATPVVAGIVVICLVFLPLLTLQGIEGRLFVPVALTIIFALGTSLLLSLTLVPVLASLLLGSGTGHEPWLMQRIAGAYAPALEAVLAHPRRAVAGAALALAAGLLAWFAIGKTFLPTMDEGDLVVQWVRLPSIGIEQAVADDLAIERALKARVPEIAHVVARLGSDELGLDPMSPNESDAILQLVPKAQWRRPDKDWLVGEIRRVLEDFPGLDFSFSQPIEMRTEEMLTGARGDVTLKLFGPDLGTVDRLGEELAARLGRLRGATDVLTQTGEGVEYLRLALDAAAIGRAGLKLDEVQDELRAELEGLPAGNVLEGARRIPIQVRGPANLRESPERFARLALARGHDRGEVPLASLARIERSNGPVAVHHENGERHALVQLNVSGRDLVGFVAEAQATIARDLALPPGYRLEWGGEFENQQRAAARLGAVVPAALALIVLVLFITFASLRQALLVLATIPFALVGGILALWLAGQYLSVPASVGFIALLGIAVLNGLVLVVHFNQLVAAGMPVAEAVRAGAAHRLRPVLMTAAITACGLVPLLFASGPGAEIQRPLAIVVIGGLSSSTVLTLLLLPLMFRRYGMP